MRRDGKIQEERKMWEMARWMKFIDLQLNPNIKKIHKPATPQKWIQFDWEKQENRKRKPPKKLRITQAEKEKLRSIFDRLGK